MGRTAKPYAITCTQTTRQPQQLARISSIAKSALEQLGVRRAELNIALVGEQRMRTIALAAGKNGPTNVLAFPYREGKEDMLGDIVLCVPYVKKEAKQYGRTPREHLVALLVHAIVHLTGRTHETDRKADAMEALERKILNRITKNH